MNWSSVQREVRSEGAHNDEDGGDDDTEKHYY